MGYANCPSLGLLGTYTRGKTWEDVENITYAFPEVVTPLSEELSGPGRPHYHDTSVVGPTAVG